MKRYSVLIAVAVFVLSLAGCTTAPSPGSTGKSRPVTNAAAVQIIEMISGEKESSYQVEALLPTTNLSSVGQPIAEKLEITQLLQKFPYEVSGGQKQRAAVARALITQPKLILADEPTGALDSRATDGLLKLFGTINGEGQTILMVTHSTKAASHANRILFIKDGEVFHQLYRGNMTNEELYVRISDTLTVLTTGKEGGYHA